MKHLNRLGAKTFSYIDTLIADRTNFQVDRKPGSASFRAVSASVSDVEAFQYVVSDLRFNSGAGCDIDLEHILSDRPGNLVDFVLVTIDQ